MYEIYCKLTGARLRVFLRKQDLRSWLETIEARRLIERGYWFRPVA